MTLEEMGALLAGRILEPDAETRALEAVAKLRPGVLPELCRLLANQRRKLQQDLERVKGQSKETRGLLEKLLAPPLVPGVVLRGCVEDGRADVAAGGRRYIAAVHPDLAGALVPGREVLLAQEGGAVVALGNPVQNGHVGTVAEIDGERVVVRTGADEELVLACAPELRARLAAGDRVTYWREFPLVLDRLPPRRQASCALEAPPRVRFADIGGIDRVIAELRSDLDLHLLHPELVARWRLRRLRGITLVGPPGVGKTMLAGAVARHLAETAPETRFLEVKPGALRGQYYGQTEARIRELFGVARAAPGLVVLFFDELDTLGRRGEGVGQELDGRVLGALLAEIDGLSSAQDVLCIGATNRLDLIDAALVREGRFGDRIYEIPRPGREATRHILARRLVPELPYEDPAAAASELIDAATSYLHAPTAGAGALARVVFADGAEREIRAPDVLSGALLAGAVERAKKRAARRELEGGAGLALDDLLDALDDGLAAEAAKVSTPAAARRSLSLPRASEIVRVAIVPEQAARPRRVLRAA